jgi:NADPH:quinone reductase-like Zn-dependent oxidoreductase
VLAGAGGDALGIIARILGAQLRSRVLKQRVGMYMARGNPEDLIALKDLAEAGKLTPVIDRTYPLSETADALRYVGTRGARGKIVIRVA